MIHYLFVGPDKMKEKNQGCMYKAMNGKFIHSLIYDKLPLMGIKNIGG